MVFGGHLFSRIYKAFSTFISFCNRESVQIIKIKITNVYSKWSENNFLNDFFVKKSLKINNIIQGTLKKIFLLLTGVLVFLLTCYLHGIKFYFLLPVKKK